MFFFDPMYLIFMIPAFVLMGVTSWYVRHSYNKWSQVRASSGLTGHQAAQRLISTGNLYGVSVQGTAGQLATRKPTPKLASVGLVKLRLCAESAFT